MTTLAIDTATRATALALCRPGSAPLEARDDPPAGARPRHAALVLPLAARLLEEAAIDWAAIERIVVGRGPGTFTGLRIGLAAARALAQARSVELVGVSTLAALALGARSAAREVGSPAVVAAVDARRGELFAAAWAASAAAAELADPTRSLLAAGAFAPAALAAWIAEYAPGALVAGDGALLARDELTGAGARVPPAGADCHRVSAASHCVLAAYAQGGGEVLPDYVRAPDARPRSAPTP